MEYQYFPFEIYKLIIKVPNQTESYSVYNYPNEVLDELLPNAILHKDYQIGEPITVRITKEYIEITSFPGIDFTISDQKVKDLNLISKKYRNKRIAEFLRNLELIEAKNTGIPKVKRALSMNNSKPLEIDMDSNREYFPIKVFINVQFNKIDLKSENKREVKEIIIEELQKKDLSLTELSKALGYFSIPNSLRRNLSILETKGVNKIREFDLNGLRLAEYQAKLFETFSNKLDCSSSIFIRRFLHSNLLKLLDKNDSSQISLDVNDGLRDIEEQYGPSNYGKIKFSRESLFWMGYLYRYISYTRNINTPLLFKLFDYKKVNELYYTYHTQSMEWCVKNLLELYNLTENIFDKNWRLKEVMKEHYKL